VEVIVRHLELERMEAEQAEGKAKAERIGQRIEI
jgi:hypothetical protein